MLATWCCLCKSSEESTNHILIHSGKAHMEWHLFWPLVGTSMVGEKGFTKSGMRHLYGKNKGGFGG